MDSMLEVALSHPKRVEILSLLEVEAATDAQLAKSAGVTCDLARYHLLVLCNARLVAPCPGAPGASRAFEIQAGS